MKRRRKIKMNTGRLLRYAFYSEPRGYYENRLNRINRMIRIFHMFLIEECLDNSGWVGFGKEY